MSASVPIAAAASPSDPARANSLQARSSSCPALAGVAGAEVAGLLGDDQESYAARAERIVEVAT
jgi:hypothetical protein